MYICLPLFYYKQKSWAGGVYWWGILPNSSSQVVEPLGWRWRRELHGRVWVGESKVKVEGYSRNLEWKVSNEVYLREDRGRWLEEIIQSSISSDSQKAIGVEYSQH